MKVNVLSDRRFINDDDGWYLYDADWYEGMYNTHTVSLRSTVTTIIISSIFGLKDVYLVQQQHSTTTLVANSSATSGGSVVECCLLLQQEEYVSKRPAGPEKRI